VTELWVHPDEAQGLLHATYEWLDLFRYIVYMRSGSNKLPRSGRRGSLLVSARRRVATASRVPPRPPALRALVSAMPIIEDIFGAMLAMAIRYAPRLGTK
jgi:hypothetical protein